MRTTLDIDDTILRELKRLQQREGTSLGRLASDLLAQALKATAGGEGAASAPKWIAKPMGARVDLEDKEAVYRALDRE